MLICITCSFLMKTLVPLVKPPPSFTGRSFVAESQLRFYDYCPSWSAVGWTPKCFRCPVYVSLSHWLQVVTWISAFLALNVHLCSVFFYNVIWQV